MKPSFTALLSLFLLIGICGLSYAATHLCSIRAWSFGLLAAGAAGAMIYLPRIL